ncbi:MAG: protein O-mannosyl-transferase family, partial [Bacteroidota bacterium]
MAAGVIGALAYTFSDSFWFSAVEGEVYALSSFFTAVVFWAILRWEHEDAKAGNDDIKRTHAERWIILIFFMMGLSIGVHLLNLLTIPAIVMVYYFRRYAPTVKGGIMAFIIGCVITGMVQISVIQWSIGLAGWFDRWFVNSFGLPFFSGFIFFFILLSGLIWYVLRIAHQRHLRFLRLGVWSFAFMLIGYSTYLTTMIRANADPGIDMNDVNNPISLVSYLNREQYGDIPLVKGQMFTAEGDYEEVGDTYQRVGDKYEITGKKRKSVYPPEQTMVFPRLWDASNDQGHADYYAQFLGIEKLQDRETGRTYYERDPNMADNLKFFFGYQINIMYWRYFMWNFSGKQNDVQGLGERRNGNWISGISFLDNMRLGKQELMPESMKKSAANNRLYMLPFVLGLLGFAYQYYRHRRDWIVSGLLFFFTGLAIVIYLNQAGPQPRERDYAYVGSFYAFAIWIGLGYFQIKEWLERVLKGVTASYLAAILCLLAVPVLMASEEWDDHDRSQKTIAPDLATNYLESCAPNAILFTVGDNDTYPLWYAQEVKGIRPDVRVINTSLLGTDWYINQLRYKVNESDPIDVIWTEDQIAGDKRNVVYHIPVSDKEDSAWADLYDVMKNQAGSEDPSKMYRAQTGELLSYFTNNKFSIAVDKNAVIANGTVQTKDSVADAVRFRLEKGYVFKNDAAVLNIIAANNWKRPIYFTQPIQIGFENYLRQDGMTYRLVPVEGARERVNTDWMLDKVLNKFRYGGATQKNVYYDEENRRHMVNIRNTHTILAMNLIAEQRYEDAKKVLRQCDAKMPDYSVPYGMASRYGNDHNEKSMYFAMAAIQAGDKELGKRVLNLVKKDCQQQSAYYASLNEGQIGQIQEYEYQMAEQLKGRIEEELKKLK